MSTVHQQPAIQVLVGRLKGQTGKPVLVTIEREEPLIHYAIGPREGFLPHRHPFDGTYTTREFAFGILTSDTLAEDTEHVATLGLPMAKHATKREAYDDVHVEEGPFWISALGDQLTAWFGTQAEVLVGAEEISNWLEAEGRTWKAEERLLNVCATADALQVNLQQWDCLKSVIVQQAAVLRADAENTYVALQQGATKLIQEATLRGPLQSLANDYARLAKRLRLLTGEEHAEPVIFPEFKKPTT